MNAKFKKGFALLLVLTMLLGILAGCGNNGGESETTAAPQAGEESTPVEQASYTYHSYMSQSPSTWNPHTWSTTMDWTILGYTSMGLYSLDFNDTRDGYTVIPEMAAADPVDVTTQYAGNEAWGIPADATQGYAYTVQLNPNATWENGEAITADDYIYSYERLLSSDMKNYRANLYYSGDLAIYNAHNYFNQDKVGQAESTTFVPWSDVYGPFDANTATEEELLAVIAEAQAAGEVFYIDILEYYWIYGPADEECIIDGPEGQRLVRVDSETLFRNEYTDDETAENYLVSGKYLWDTQYSWLIWDWWYSVTPGYTPCVYLYVEAEVTVPEITFENVGILKTGEYELTYIVERPIDLFDFKIALTDVPLVYEEIYEASITAGGSKYGTSLDTWMSYGPYKLTEYQDGKQITLERNDAWYGYTDGKHEGMYQTTAVDLKIVESQATALQLFLQGKLDSVALDTSDMGTYGTSEYIQYTPTEFTYRLTPNTNYEMLQTRQSEGKNKTILSYKDFRKALSLCIDRSTYCNSVYAGMQPAYGLWSNLYLVDAENGIPYRSTEQAQNVLKEVYGVSDVDDITGYDPDQARALFVKAYEEALAAGDITETDVISLDLISWSGEGGEMRQFNFYQDCINAAVAGTVLEGRIVLEMVPDPTNYYQRSYDGQFELSMPSWGGDTLNVFAQCEYYRDDYASCSEYQWGSATTMVTVNIGGQDITKSYNDWTDALLTGEYSSAELDVRVDIFAALEKCLLINYVTIPVDISASTGLYSHRVIFGSEEYIPQMGYGGVAYMTYTMNDADWAAYCAEQGNQLTY